MSDRGVFVAAFLTVVLIIASAFEIRELFFYELVVSSIYVAISVLVYTGEDRTSYMLGMVVPPLSFILNVLLGGFFSDLGVMWGYLTGKGVAPTDTPLHGFAVLTEILLAVLCFRAWRREVGGPGQRRTFVISLGIGLAYCAVLFGWYFEAFSIRGRMP